MGQRKNKIRMPNFRKANSKFFRELVNKILWDSVLRDRGMCNVCLLFQLPFSCITCNSAFFWHNHSFSWVGIVVPSSWDSAVPQRSFPRKSVGNPTCHNLKIIEEKLNQKIRKSTPGYVWMSQSRVTWQSMTLFTTAVYVIRGSLVSADRTWTKKTPIFTDELLFIYRTPSFPKLAERIYILLQIHYTSLCFSAMLSLPRNPAIRTITIKLPLMWVCVQRRWAPIPCPSH